MDSNNNITIENVANLLKEAAVAYGSYSAVNYGNNAWSYEQIYKMARGLASSISDSFPVKKGQKIMVVLPPSLQLILSYFSLWELGMSPIPVDSKLPLEFIKKIAGSGKVSGIITFESLYDRIRGEETSSLFTILTNPVEFRSSFSGKNPDMDRGRIRGSRSKGMEEMCYNEDFDEFEIDPVTDIAVSNVGWNEDGSFNFLNFSHQKLLNSLNTGLGCFPLRETSPFIVTKEPLNAVEIIISQLLPLKKGCRMVMVEDASKNIGYFIDKNSMDEPCNIWVSRKTLEYLKTCDSMSIERLSIIYSNHVYQAEELDAFGNKKSSIFSMIEDENFCIPLGFLQHLKNENINRCIKTQDDKNELDVNSFSEYWAEEMTKLRGNVDLSKIYQFSPDLIYGNGGTRGNNYLLGNSVPVKMLEDWLRTQHGFEEVFLSLESSCLEIKKAKKESSKLLELMPEFSLPFKFAVQNTTQ